MKDLLKADFTKRTQATLQWLEHSIQSTAYQGSAAYYHLWKGWASPYPETTGYIIETLLDYSIYLGEEKWKNLAIACSDWLCRIQHADGSFPGGIGTTGAPIVFDTGQILFGLTSVFAATNDVKYKTALQSAVAWLLSNLEPDGSWQRHTYQPHYVPTYYTQVVWAILQANQILNSKDIEQQMQQALHFYWEKKTTVYTFSDWGFRAGESAYTHTIAYVMRGFLESGHLLKEPKWIQIVMKMADKMIEDYDLNGKFAGRYNENWKGDYRFQCLTGDAQISLVLARLYQLTNKTIYLYYAISIFQRTFSQQWLLPIPGLCGGIPGSSPVWGVYQRFKFPNWAAKFYLDAYLLINQLQE